MSWYRRERPRAGHAPRICAPVSRSIGRASRSDGKSYAPTLDVDHSRVPAGLEPDAGPALPLLSQLFLLYPHSDRTPWSVTRNLARDSPYPALSPFCRGWLRPCAGQEIDQCLIPASCFGSRSLRSSFSITKRGCEITPRRRLPERFNPRSAAPV